MRSTWSTALARRLCLNLFPGCACDPPERGKEGRRKKTKQLRSWSSRSFFRSERRVFSSSVAPPQRESSAPPGRAKGARQCFACAIGLAIAGSKSSVSIAVNYIYMLVLHSHGAGNRLEVAGSVCVIRFRLLITTYSSLLAPGFLALSSRRGAKALGDELWAAFFSPLPKALETAPLVRHRSCLQPSLYCFFKL